MSTPTVYAGIDAGCTTLYLWYKDKPGWVEIRGCLDIDENDPLQKVIDSVPAWFVSGLMSDDYVAVTPWDRYEGSYNILRSLLDGNAVPHDLKRAKRGGEK